MDLSIYKTDRIKSRRHEGNRTCSKWIIFASNSENNLRLGKAFK